MEMQTDLSRSRIDIPKELEPLIPGFLDRRDSDVKEIRGMIENEDFEGIALLGHRLKGQGGGYGLYIITDLGAELEKAAKDSNVREAQMAVDKLELELRSIRDKLGL